MRLVWKAYPAPRGENCEYFVDATFDFRQLFIEPSLCLIDLR